MHDHYWPFLLFVIVMTGTPGPGNLAMLALGQTVGFKKSIPFLIGMVTGATAVGLLVSLGLGELYINSPRTASVFKIVSIAYILYLALKVMRMNVQPPEQVKPFTIYDGLMLHPLNPKAWAMSISAFSQFADPTAPRFFEISVFVLTFTYMGVLSHSFWGLTGSSLLRIMRAPKLRLCLNTSMVVLMVGATLYALYN
ncbi:LysE family translocator [Desulfovibrio gilichinskyi]|uniref:Threonine/homoserine/homoserine lactone efflux protein n=1 Tax=Desulfovibrio gilichinskyi TaxID=1519643 RepID=A0A1X7DXI0_9BACT|nr:LysE family translocator [Desulfovibrio gilichinskyi]SMF23612.1 Threonine/homoserine/homoserine lactone efflux protein [Desulfovibrio gilichinskyi]